MYQLLVGKPPFDGAAETVMYRVCNCQPESLLTDEQARRWVHYDPVVMQALAKSPCQRYESAQAFRDAILAAYAGPVNATVSEATVIVSSRGHGHGARDASGSSGGSTSGGGTPWPPGWDASTLGSVETQLALVVGPMARVLVQRAARRCSDLDTLLNMIAGGLDTSEEKRAFLARVSTGTPRPAGGRSPVPMAQPSPEGLFSNSRLETIPPHPSPEEIEQAGRALAKYIGPLARLIVKRASERATDVDEFYRLVAEDIASEPDRKGFLRDAGR